MLAAVQQQRFSGRREGLSAQISLRLRPAPRGAPPTALKGALPLSAQQQRPLGRASTSTSHRPLLVPHFPRLHTWAHSQTRRKPAAWTQACTQQHPCCGATSIQVCRLELPGAAGRNRLCGVVAQCSLAVQPRLHTVLFRLFLPPPTRAVTASRASSISSPFRKKRKQPPTKSHM